MGVLYYTDDEAAYSLFVKCVMVLSQKRFLEHEIEFTVQTDLFDDQGTLWQSVTWLSVPFTQDTLIVPLSASGFQIDEKFAARASESPRTTSIKCTSRNFAEFAEVAMTDLGANKAERTPVLWMLGQVSAILQRENRVPALPLMCNCSIDEGAAFVPLNTSLTVESLASGEKDAHQTVKFAVTSTNTPVMHGLLRTVGWTFTPEYEELES